MYYGRHRTFRLPFLGCLLGVLCILLPVPAPADVASVQKLLKQDKLQDALSSVNDDLKQSSDNVTLRFLKGVILTRLNRLDDAEKIFKELISTHPELPEPYNNLAVIYAAEGKFEDARTLLQKAIDTHPSYATADENLGDIYAKMASQAYNHALQLDEHNESAKAKLALINNLFSLSDRSGAASAAPAVTAASRRSAAPESTGCVAPSQASMKQGQAAAHLPPAPTQAQAGGAQVTGTSPSTAAAATAGSTAPKVVEAAPMSAPEQSAAAKPQKAAGPQPASSPAAAKVAAAATAKAEPSNADPVAAVRRAIGLWVTAWSDKDVDAYLSRYARDFKPEGHMSRRRWNRERKRRISKPAFIRIRVSKVRINLNDPDHATAHFTQSYQSDTYSDRVTKTLTFKKVDAKWLITSETTG